MDGALLLVPAAIAASYAFMLPAATPRNGIVLGSGYVRLSRMALAGFWLNLIGTLLAAPMADSVGGVLLHLDLRR